MTEKLLTLGEVADVLGVPPSTLHQWKWKGTGPRWLKVGRHLRMRPEDLESWLEASAQAGEVG